MASLQWCALALLLACAANTSAAVVSTFDDTMAPDGSRFRTDYKYDKLSNGWFKYHIMPASWYSAHLTCQLEGAQLASPSNPDLHAALRTMLQEHRAHALFTGIHSLNTQEEYLSAEGKHLTEMALEWAEGEPDNANNTERCLALRAPGLAADVDCHSLLPFACHRPKDGIMSLNECGTYDNGYKRSSKTGSCYKIHLEAKSWLEAHRVCIAEGAHLVILNTEEEAKELRRNIPYKNEVFIGVFKQNDDWFTLDGKVLGSRGTWRRWRAGEPNNVNGNELCAAFVDGATMVMNDYPCAGPPQPFICEAEAPRALHTRTD